MGYVYEIIQKSFAIVGTYSKLTERCQSYLTTKQARFYHFYNYVNF